jgi:hypothetical protein
LAMVRCLQLGDCNVVGSKPAGKRARCKDQLQKQMKGGDLVRSFLPAARRPSLNRGARKVGLTSVATGRCAGVGEESGAGSSAMKQRTAVRKAWPSRGSRTTHRVFASWAVVGAEVMASRYMAAVQHRSDAQAFHRAGRERGGRPCRGRRKAAAWWHGTARRCSR